MNQTLEGYTSRFRKNIFRPKYTDVVKIVRSYRIYRYGATSARHFSVANMAEDSVVNATVRYRRNTDTAFISGHAYLKVSISRVCLSQAFMHQQSTSAITRKRETTSNLVRSTIEKDALPISSQIICQKLCNHLPLIY